MMIKSFTAESAAAALKQVRREMGGDAIVLKTRQVTGGENSGKVEITACLERPTVAQSDRVLSPAVAPEKAPLKVEAKPSRFSMPAEEPVVSRDNGAIWQDTIAAMNRKLDRLLTASLHTRPADVVPDELRNISDRLRQAAFDDDFVADFIGCLATSDNEISSLVIREQLSRNLASMMAPSVTFEPGDRLVFVGPPGSGKSSVMGKIAADLVARQKKAVSLMSLDNSKVAAYDELCSYSEILGVPILESRDTDTAPEFDSDKVTLIDAPSLPGDPAKADALAKTIEKLNPSHCFAVVSALLNAADLERLCELMSPLNPTHVVGTMYDLSGRCGLALMAARGLQCPLAFTSNSQAGIGQLEVADPGKLARTLMPAEVTLG